MAVTVQRPTLNWRERMYLPAIAAGLVITIKHFKNMLFGRTKVTMQYPEEKWDSSLPDYYRGAPALVRPNSMFLKCLIVMARPAAIAGKYIRSRQFSFGRGTVIAMITSPNDE